MRALISDIARNAAQLSGFSLDALRGPGRTKPIVMVRNAAFLIAREQMRQDEDAEVQAYSTPQIGRYFGRDHSTVIHGLAKAEQSIAKDPQYAEFVGALRGSCDGSPWFGTLAPAELIPDEPIPVATEVKPMPKPLPAMARSTHIKAITLNEGEIPDQGHKFHAGIGLGSAKLLKALAA